MNSFLNAFIFIVTNSAVRLREREREILHTHTYGVNALMTALVTKHIIFHFAWQKY